MAKSLALANTFPIAALAGLLDEVNLVVVLSTSSTFSAPDNGSDGAKSTMHARKRPRGQVDSDSTQ